IISATNKLLLLHDGMAKMFGPTNQVLEALTKQQQQAQQALLAQQEAKKQAAQNQMTETTHVVDSKTE
ncbi:MAG: type I secretion system permease/ATPase, partial [Nitrosomonas sp.]|nr:type I secretion system permease/ATPase [Nitrosomonas sp.]